MLKTIVTLALLAPLAAHACPKSLVGNYVVYGTKSSPSWNDARAGLVSVGPISGGVGSITAQSFVYSGSGTDGSHSGDRNEVAGIAARYTYDGKCAGYLWQPDEDDDSKLQVQFFYVSDKGAQIVLIDGPTGVAKNSAGNPVLPLPTEWENRDSESGITIFRKQ